MKLERPTTDGEFEEVGAILDQAFNTGERIRTKYFDVAGRDNIRMVREGSRIAGGLADLPMGQFFGGRSLPTSCVACVGTAPDLRGRGIGLQLMNLLLEQRYEARTPLSSLYPSAIPLYRKSGYERAGSHTTWQVPTKGLSGAKGGGAAHNVRPMEESDGDAVHALYRRCAEQTPGHLDRSAFIWHRVFRDTFSYVIETGGEIDGYVVFKQTQQSEGLYYDLHCTDLVAMNLGAATALRAFLGSHGSLASRVSWVGGAADNFTYGLDMTAKVRRHWWWMTRLVHVEEALSARGYPQHVRARLDLDVTDDVLAGNTRRYRLEVEGGESQCSEGGDGTLRIDVRGLAALFTGFASPVNLKRAGLLDGDDAVLSTAASIFAGPDPWMPDMF